MPRGRGKRSRRPTRQRAQRSQRVKRARSSVVSHLPGSRLPREDLNSAVCRQLSPFANITTQLYRTKGFYSAGTVFQVASVNTYGSLAFTASSASNFADLSAVFDMYRIVGASVSFVPQVTQNITNTAYMPRLFSVIDYDDAATPTSINQLLQYDSIVIGGPCRAHIRALDPHIAVAAYSGAFTSFANLRNQWIDIASATVQHYGLKFACEAGLAGQTNLQQYQVDVELFMEFKSTR